MESNNKFLQTYIAKYNEQILSVEQVDDIMETANKLLDGYGVELLTDERGDWSSYYGYGVILYVNLGDTYETTLVYDIKKTTFLVTSWGDFYDEWDSKLTNR
jgi:protein-L-isoaspartate O-methyltransferase